MRRDRNGCNKTLFAGSFSLLHFCFSNLFGDLREGPALPGHSGGEVFLTGADDSGTREVG